MAKRKLPEKKTANQVWAEVDKLFYSRPMQAYHAQIPVYRANTLMRLELELPESFEEGVSMMLPSSKVLEVVAALAGKAVGFVRYTDAVAKAERSGVPSQKLVEKADRVGRTLTVMNAGLDPAKRKTRAMHEHQLADGWCVLHLHRRGRPGQGFKWEVEIAEPMTCAFTEETGGAFVPKRLARKFTMLMSQAQADYAGRGDLSKTETGFDWAPLSAPRSLWDGPAFAGANTGGEGVKDVEVEVCIYDDGYYVYHGIRSTGTAGTNEKPKLLYCERNTCYTPNDGTDDYECENGAMAVVVPGDTFSFGGDGEKMLPVAFSVQNNANNLNLLRAIRGRSAIKDRPEMVVGVNATPEEFEQLQKLGAVKPVDGQDGGPIIFIPTSKDTTITPWQLRTNQDLDSLDQAIREDLRDSIAQLIVDTNPEVVAAASATAYHISTGETGARHEGWIGNVAFAWAAVDQMICNDVVNVDDEYEFTSSEAQPRSGSKEVPKGAYMTLTPDDLAFPYEVTVVIKQETEDQKSKRLMNRIFLRHEGVSTLMNVIEEDTVDVTARVKELFIDYTRQVAQPILITKYYVPMLDEAIKTGAGVWLQLNAQDFMPPSAAPGPSAMPPQGQTFAPQPPQGSQGDAIGNVA